MHYGVFLLNIYGNNDTERKSKDEMLWMMKQLRLSSEEQKQKMH
ncbi:protein of unknown function [Candidatus Nitrosacidococcus tergens]|uniref:Uncharacterized protein n=1 Tax=Candidatus Nitrosacidococcus tergens TaxID=553981 RepID=A0A7G1Q8F8_9GAMM|nr:protein of unknown function [Candidatus Nitrosacidococcus tergens]